MSLVQELDELGVTSVELGHVFELPSVCDIRYSRFAYPGQGSVTLKWLMRT
jgi:hypothetical protein